MLGCADEAPRPDADQIRSVSYAVQRALQHGTAAMYAEAYLRCFGGLADLPALHLVLSRCEEVYELDGLEARGDYLGQRADCLILQSQRRCQRPTPPQLPHASTSLHGWLISAVLTKPHQQAGSDISDIGISDTDSACCGHL